MKSVLSALVVAGVLAAPLSAQLPKRVNTPEMRIDTYASSEVVTPGSAFSLVFDIAPLRGVHVYAPGNHAYKVLHLTLEPNPHLVVHPMEYPASEIMEFGAAKELVPVFEKPFRVEQPVEVSAAPKHRAALAKMKDMTIRGTLEYQACDRKVCYPPRSIPVSYSVRLKRPA